MSTTINAKQLRASLPDVVRRVSKGARFMVIYRSRPAFRIVPVESVDQSPVTLQDDPLYRAEPLGRSSDGRAASDHDDQLYGR